MDLLLNRNLQTNFFIFFIGVALLQYLDSKGIICDGINHNTVKL